jgi:hypothetical protein
MFSIYLLILNNVQKHVVYSVKQIFMTSSYVPSLYIHCFNITVTAEYVASSGSGTGASALLGGHCDAVSSSEGDSPRSLSPPLTFSGSGVQCCQVFISSKSAVPGHTVVLAAFWRWPISWYCSCILFSCTPQSIRLLTAFRASSFGRRSTDTEVRMSPLPLSS